jgi:uncharacterized repeat protein (TIGR01451 family)
VRTEYRIMKTSKKFLISGVTGIAAATLIAAPALAWHPELEVTKYVTNVTAGGEMADANDTKSAVNVKSGDTIVYTIVVANTAGKPARGGNNDLNFTKLTDTLPAGVELVSDPSKREIVEEIGLLKPGEKTTKTYTLKVTGTTDGAIVTNEACATGDSLVEDAFRKDCDPAVIKVSVPPKPEEPKVLAQTGPANVLASAGAVTALGYIGNMLRLKHRASKRD